MKRLLLAASCLGLALPFCAAAPRAPKPIKVFILAGQSNMEGKGDGGKLSADEQAQLAGLKGRVEFAYNHQPIRPLGVTPAGGNKKRFGVDTTFGPEMFFGLRVAEDWQGERILLIKRSLGNTTLYGVWNPNWTAEKAAKTGESKLKPLYADTIAYVREVLSRYRPDQYQLCGMLWVQGESDGAVKKVGREPEEAYGANFRNLIQSVRRDLNAPDLPFLAVEVGSPKVTAGMEATARELKNVSLIPRSRDESSPNFFPQYKVGHYNYEGQKRIGSLLAAAYLQHYAGRVQPASKIPLPHHPPEKVVVFRTTPQEALKAYFYFPPGWSAADRRPGIIFWSGGAFRSGRANQFLSHAEYFASRGLVAVHVEHRGRLRDNVMVDSCVDDARFAIQWLKEHAAEYGIDPAKVIASGGSAGGTLALLTASAASTRPAAFVLFNPAMGQPVIDEIGRGGPDQAAVNAEILSLDTPRPDEPPSILFYGSKDTRYVDLARGFAHKVRAQGGRCDVWVAQGQSHGFFNNPHWHEATLRLADEFLASLGYLKGPPTIPPEPTAALAADKLDLLEDPNLSNWTLYFQDPPPDPKSTWSLADGVLRLTGVPKGYLRTRDSYSNYRLHVEWRWPKSAPANTNSGVFFHVYGADKLWPDGIEAQLRTGFAGQLGGVHVALSGVTGKDGRYRALRQKASSEKPFGEWNTYDITCRGASIEVLVNGVRQNFIQTSSVSAGALGLQMEGFPIEFRHVWLEPL